MSDSEESDNIGYLVESDDGSDAGDESGSGAEGSQASHSEPESNPLFDLEAADSDGETDSNENDGGFGSWSEDHLFPQFNRLPIELRHHIWEFFCPDLSVKGRVYWFILQRCCRKKDLSGGLTISEGGLLEQQTRPTRAMLAVHHESRQIALKAFPDTLAFDDHSVLRFNAKRDIILLDSTKLPENGIDMYKMPQFRGFSEHIHHLAIEPAMFSREINRKWNSSTLSGTYPNLKTLHYVSGPTYHRPQNLRWCTSELAKLYTFSTCEDEPGLGENGQQLYCWPDFENPRAFVEAEVPVQAAAKAYFGTSIDIRGANLDGVTVWPMIEFSLDPKQPGLNDLVTWDGKEDLGWDWSEGEDDEEPNEYESEGIDDSYISSDDSLRLDAGDLVVLDDDDDDSDQEEERSAGRLSVVSGTSQQRSQDGAIDLTGDDPGVVAAFSSPEQSSATLQGSEESAHGSDQPVPRKSRTKRPRARVVESDSEGDSADDMPRKRARTENRQNPIVLSSDDEEDERRKMRANRRTRTVISDDEDEEDRRDTGNTDQGQDGGTDWSGISSSDDEDEESEEGAAKPLSLAEKLQLHRHNNPIPPSDDDDSELEDMGGDDYDARNYADFQDDEGGNEVSDDGEEDGQDELSLGDDDDEDGGY